MGAVEVNAFLHSGTFYLLQNHFFFVKNYLSQSAVVNLMSFFLFTMPKKSCLISAENSEIIFKLLSYVSLSLGTIRTGCGLTNVSWIMNFPDTKILFYWCFVLGEKLLLFV